MNSSKCHPICLTYGVNFENCPDQIDQPNSEAIVPHLQVHTELISIHPPYPSLIMRSSSSVEILPLMSVPSSRLSARSRFCLCKSTIFSSMVFWATRR